VNPVGSITTSYSAVGGLLYFRTPVNEEVLKSAPGSADNVLT
jgi:hypothetical protein